MKVAIVGGGPAGAMLAHQLGRADVPCTLFEKNGAWEKPCGGGIPPKVREQIPEIRDFDGKINSVTLGEFVAPGGRSVLLESRNPMWIVSRKEFGRFLLDMARGHSSVTYSRKAVRRIDRKGKRFDVITDRTETFDFVVGADGCRSKVGALADKVLPKDLLTQCVGFFVKAHNEQTAVSWMLPAPGYIWAFPRKDHICVGGGCADGRLAIAVYARDIIRTHFPGREVVARWAAPIPLVRDPGFYARPTCGPGWALVGDAAAHVDALTGEGILYALLGGRLLGQALAQGRPEQYEEAWRDVFGSHLERASELSLRFYRPQTMEKVFKVAASSPTLRRFLMDVMSDQPSYLEAGKRFSVLSWRVLLESLGGTR